MANLINDEIRVAINNAFNEELNTELDKVTYLEFDSTNKKHKFEMMCSGVMGGIFANVITNTYKAEEDRKNICFAIPEASEYFMRISWFYSDGMDSGFFDSTDPDSNVKVSLSKEFKSDRNDKLILRVTDTQADDLVNFSYGDDIDILKMSLSLSSMKKYTKDIGNDKVMKALFETKSAEKMAFFANDKYGFTIHDKWHSIVFAQYDGGIHVRVGKRMKEYSCMLSNTTEFDIPNTSFTIFELYKFLRMKKGGLLYDLNGFKNPDNAWLMVAQGAKEIDVKYKYRCIDTEEEDVERFSMENYAITELKIVG